MKLFYSLLFLTCIANYYTTRGAQVQVFTTEQHLKQSADNAATLDERTVCTFLSSTKKEERTNEFYKKFLATCASITREQLNVTDADGNTALLLAVMQEDTRAAACLFYHSIDSMICNKAGHYYFSLASQELMNKITIDLLAIPEIKALQ